MLGINISTGGGTPIFRQIVDQVRGAVAGGKLEVGGAMPSVRALARELVVNPNTIAKAYAQLVRDGVLESHQGRGYFVAQRRQIYTKAERKRRLDEAATPFLAEAVTLGFSADEIVDEVHRRLHDMMPADSVPEASSSSPPMKRSSKQSEAK